MKQYQLEKRQNKIFITVISCVIFLFASTATIFASNENCITPTDEQYFELRAVSIKDVAGQNKQVMMELWGNDIEFKRI